MAHNGSILKGVGDAFYIVAIVFLGFSSCEESIDIDIDTFEKRPVIVANFEISRDSSYTGNVVFIRKSTSFFDEVLVSIEDAKVTVKNTQNDSLYSYEHFRNGLYVNNDLVLLEDVTYELSVSIYEEEYVARAKSVSNTPITKIDYTGERTVDNEEFAEFKLNFTDREDEKNYYLFEIDFGNPRVLSDDFFDGEDFNFSMFKRTSEISDDQVIVRSYGLDKDYFTYLTKIIELNDPQFYGPFSTAPASPRGNIINLTNKNNFAFGYFQISVVYEKRFTFATQ